MNKKIIIAIIAIIVAAFVGYAFTHQQATGGAGLPSKYGTTVIDANLTVTGQETQGGVDSITNTVNAATYTLTSGDVQNSVISFVSGTSTVTTTVTLPATSTLTTWLPNVGDVTTIYFVNASSTMGTVTIAAGAGETLLSATSTGIISAGKVGALEFIRNTASTLLVGFSVRN